MITVSLVFSTLFKEVFGKTEYVARAYAAKIASGSSSERTEDDVFADIAATEDDSAMLSALFAEAHSSLSNALKDYIDSSVIVSDTATVVFYDAKNRNEAAVKESVEKSVENYFVYYATGAWLQMAGLSDYAAAYSKQGEESVQEIKYALSARRKPTALGEDDYTNAQETNTDISIEGDTDGGIDYTNAQEAKRDSEIGSEEYAVQYTNAQEEHTDTAIGGDAAGSIEYVNTQETKRDTAIDDGNTGAGVEYTERTEDTNMGCMCGAGVEYTNAQKAQRDTAISGESDSSVEYAARPKDIPIRQYDGFYRLKSKINNHDYFND